MKGAQGHAAPAPGAPRPYGAPQGPGGDPGRKVPGREMQDLGHAATTQGKPGSPVPGQHPGNPKVQGLHLSGPPLKLDFNKINNNPRTDFDKMLDNLSGTPLPDLTPTSQAKVDGQLMFSLEGGKPGPHVIAQRPPQLATAAGGPPPPGNIRQSSVRQGPPPVKNPAAASGAPPGMPPEATPGPGYRRPTPQQAAPSTSGKQMWPMGKPQGAGPHPNGPHGPGPHPRPSTGPIAHTVTVRDPRAGAPLSPRAKQYLEQNRPQQLDTRTGASTSAPGHDPDVQSVQSGPSTPSPTGAPESVMEQVEAANNARDPYGTSQLRKAGLEAQKGGGGDREAPRGRGEGPRGRSMSPTRARAGPSREPSRSPERDLERTSGGSSARSSRADSRRSSRQNSHRSLVLDRPSGVARALERRRSDNGRMPDKHEKKQKMPKIAPSPQPVNDEIEEAASKLLGPKVAGNLLGGRSKMKGKMKHAIQETVDLGKTGNGIRERGDGPVDSFVDGFSKVVKDAYKKETNKDFEEHIRKSANETNIMRPKPPKAYDPRDNFTNIFKWHSTAIKLVFTKLDFWLLLVAHIVISVFYHGGLFGIPEPTEEQLQQRVENEADGYWPIMTNATMLILGSFLTFFLVFFNSQAYARFFQEYFISCEIKWLSCNFLMLLRTHIKSPFVQLTAVRLLHASIYLGYMYLPQNYELPGFVNNGWVRLRNMKCLSEPEVAHLRLMVAGKPHTETLLWSLHEIHNEMTGNRIKIPIYRSFEGTVHKIRDLFDHLDAYTYQPIPFLYYHLVNVSAEIYLSVLCYTAVKITAYWSILGYAVVLIAIFGLREAASCLADPLGLDECDIPIFDHVRNLHFEHVYALTHLGNRTPTPGPLPGYGGASMLNELCKGMEPHMFAPRDGKEAQDHLAKPLDGDKHKEPEVMKLLEGVDTLRLNDGSIFDDANIVCNLHPHYYLQLTGQLEVEQATQDIEQSKFWTQLAAGTVPTKESVRDEKDGFRSSEEEEEDEDDDDDDDDDDDE